ncbi:MAG: HAD-IIB family hydrolase [Terracidiphilus sp.]|nr:HAD-IIB family hydrolase [Terracidiphilus sp.]
MKALAMFDLDGTLAQSKLPLTPEMVSLLHRLLSVIRVAIISGGAWPQFEQQVLLNLPQDERLQRLSILPACGTQFFQYTDEWNRLYAEELTSEEKRRIFGTLNTSIHSVVFGTEQHWGETIEDRGSQITYSALGQQAPLEAKLGWDADFVKRKAIKTILDALIPEFSIRLGGTTSIDITKPGIDKAYGIGKLRDILGIPLPQMIYIGDALFPGGNDYPAMQAGVTCISVRSPSDTAVVIETIVACLDETWPVKSLPSERKSLCRTSSSSRNAGSGTSE